MSDHRSRGRRVWPFVLGLLVVITAGIIACSPSGIPPSTAFSSAAPTSVQLKGTPAATPVTFEVKGHGVPKATSITYGAGGSQSQANGKSLPWSSDVTPSQPFAPLSLVAQSGSQAETGSITCVIRQGNKIIESKTSEGPFAVVTCSGSED